MESNDSLVYAGSDEHGEPEGRFRSALRLVYSIVSCYSTQIVLGGRAVYIV